ncbi:hypothetical protein F2Q69_00007473 [Brassica cretica]|uniref:Uncharacterized protein n=1 Tax=Brassica cretica TaxID=69181 RepID=A0A8S9P994_BRACR|nr:hypothetical protein F2Q69_00007473 [Brassica cretica]
MHGLMSYRRFGRARSLRSDRALTRARSLRSDRALGWTWLLRSDRTACMRGNYATVELGYDQAFAPLDRYAASELFQNVDATLVHAFSSTLRCYLPKTVANPFHVPRHSKLSIKLYRANRGKFVLYRKKP